MSSLGRIAALIAGGCLAGCGSIDIPDYATMPRTIAGTPVVSDQGAMQLASYDLGVPSRTAGRPDQAALALASIDYLAGALYANPHWIGIPATTKLRMLMGRAEIRQVLGIPPNTPSQVVVNSLVAASYPLGAGDLPGARAALPENVFTLGPDRTIAFLTNMPYLPQANVAAQSVNADTSFNCQTSINCG